MKRAIWIAAALLAACNSEQSSTQTTDTRMPIEVQYVRDGALKIHTKPADGAPVVTTYQHGESVSVLSRRGEWAEVRIAAGSGWVHAIELAGADEATKEADNTKPHFLRDPQPVTQPGAHGEVILEADVYTDGVVTNVRTLRNTTGSNSLETRNAASLRAALFTPAVRHGRREAFVYEHRVHY
ncbi:MAG: Bacterial domain [Thermoanaerobaculia bacterium]|nr:Bacterial domain [Thermoanaerobaculia bacterium]